MRKTITATIVAAAATAAVGGAGIAAASSQAAGTTGTEYFQAMSTNGTSSTTSVIGYGVFTGAAVDHEQAHNVDTFVFANGTIRIRHAPSGRTQQSVNPKTCLLTVDQHGTYRITGGTGHHAGISGHGTYRLSILAVAARTAGKCAMSKPPAGFHQLITASGPVTLK